jgi:hypothetical protein
LGWINKPRLLMADIVAKVENRITLEISRKLIFGRLCGCVAFQRHWEGPWSTLDETIWSPHVAARKAHQRLQEFSFATPEKLLQQYRHL